MTKPTDGNTSNFLDTVVMVTELVNSNTNIRFVKMFRRLRRKSSEVSSEANENKSIQEKESSSLDEEKNGIQKETEDIKRIMYNSDLSGESDLDIPLEDESLLAMERYIQEVPSKAPKSGKPQSSSRPAVSSKAGPSRELSSENRPKSGGRPKPILSSSDSESETDDEVMMVNQTRGPLPGEYDPDKYNDLQVPDEIRDLFQYITKYTPQHLNLDYKFRPFIPEYIPAVGDIDAFLKVVPPENFLSGAKSNFTDLGLNVLDEPAAYQSDSALLHLQLRAVSITTNKDNKNMIIKKIDNVEKNTKVIEKWIKDISDLHRTKPPPMVKYSNTMPDLDNLMQEWPPKVEMLLRKDGFPSHKLKCTLSQYIDLVCKIFDIPLKGNRIERLHMLFSLYIAIKNSQLYKLEAERNMENVVKSGTDQLILE